MRRARSVIASTVLLLGVARAASAHVPSPSLEGPIDSSASAFVAATSFDPARVGYVQQEFFIAGTATAYTNTAPLGVDGMWSVAPGATAAYKTRIVVYRPTNPRKFHGTVVVEWLNVSGGLDAGPDWTLGHTELIREGVAWVGVSAQRTGVEGGNALLPVVDLPLKKADPARYASLSHPGDSFSYDIFSQAAELVRQSGAGGPLGGLRVKRMIATGESQSAFRMVTYVDAFHPITRLFDGYLIHSRGSIDAPLSEGPQTTIQVPGTAQIRADVDVPVLTFETESDLILLGYFGARQDDSAHFRLWEVPGTSHADSYLLVTGSTDTGSSPSIADLVVTSDPLGEIAPACAAPINSGPQHFVVNAAFAALIRWVRQGKAPKPVPRLEVAAGSPPAIMHDAHGNALGGARTPVVDVPIAAFTGEQPGGSLLCVLLGTTTPFDASTLATLYPSHRAFVSAYAKSIKRALKAGVLVKADAKLLRKWAAASGIGR